MILTVAVSSAALIGALIFSVLWTLIPKRTSAAVELARWEAHQARGRRTATTTIPTGTGSLAKAQYRLGAVLTTWATARGVEYTSLRQDLALTGRSLEGMMGRKVLGFVAGFVAVPVTVTAAHVMLGVSVPLIPPALLALACGAVLFVVPDLEARREATARRRDFRRALSSFLVLVSLEMAASAAPAEALPATARIGILWPFALLRETLRHASMSNQDHWDALIDLGERIGVPELVDLGTAIRSVGRDGAQVRETLITRAATIRRTLLADIEGTAGQRDQSMLVAQIVLGAAFAVFIIYPALVNVLSV